MNFHKQRAITLESLVRYGPLDIMVLNNVTKFHKILIKNIRVRERTTSGQTYVRTYVCTYVRTGVTLNAPAIIMAGA